jgi:transposase
MKAFQPTDFAVLIGIDWADRKHDICILNPDSESPEYQVIPATAQSIHNWAIQLKHLFPNRIVAIACELKKGPLIYALEQYDHIVIFPINPSTVAQFRKAFTHSGAKDDPSDALIQAQLLQRHMDKLKPIEAEDPTIRALSRLVEARRKLVQDRVDLSNRVTNLLKSYYPQALDLFKEKDTIIFCNFIAKWPSLEEAKRARPSTLQNFFNEHNSRYGKVNQRRIDEIKSSQPLTQDQGIIEPCKLLIGILIRQLKLLIEAIESLDKEVKQRYRAQKDKAIFDSFPGAGPQLAPRLLVAFGANRDRYNSAADIQKYAGVAPVIERSGQKTWTHWRYSCPKFLRQTFVEWAGQSVRFSFWAKAFYQQQIAKGKPHNCAIRALAFKWIRIAFQCWKSRTPYNESKYLEALKLRGSPLLEYALKN